MKVIYYLVTNSKEYLNDPFHVFQQYFIQEHHLLHSLLITLAIALFLAIIFYFVFGFLSKRMCTPTTWWVLLLLTGVMTFFGTGATNGLKNSKSQHSLSFILEKKYSQIEPGVPKTEKQQYPQYKALKDKMDKGMFKVKPVLNMALTNLVLSILFFWIFSIVFRLIVPDSNTAKGVPNFLNKQKK